MFYQLFENRDRLHIHTPHKSTLPIQRAMRAIGPLRVADVASMGDQVHVQRVHPFRRRDLRVNQVRLLRRHFRPDQTQTPRRA